MKKQNRIQLKGLKTCNSQEGIAFSANIYLDGKKLGQVLDAGNGGMIEYQLYDKEIKALQAFANTLFEKGVDDKGHCGYSPKNDMLDYLVNFLVDDSRNVKKFNRMSKTKTLFRVKGDKKDEFRILSSAYSPKVKAYLLKEFKDQIEIVWGVENFYTTNEKPLPKKKIVPMRKLNAKKPQKLREINIDGVSYRSLFHYMVSQKMTPKTKKWVNLYSKMYKRANSAACSTVYWA